MIESIGGHCPAIQHLPIGSLKMHGENPYGEAMFRVVWSESRYYMVGASHTDYDGDPSNDMTVRMREKDPNVLRRTVGYKWLPLYPGQPRWILEMWKSPLAFTGCSPEQYEINYRDPITLLLTLGPYPTKGEYCQCQSAAWTGLGPGREEVDKTIYLIKAGWNYSYKDHMFANRDYLEAQEKQKANEFEARFKEARPAFGNRPTSLNPGKKSQNDIRITRSAQEVGLNPRHKGLVVGNEHAPISQQVAR